MPEGCPDALHDASAEFLVFLPSGERLPARGQEIHHLGQREESKQDRDKAEPVLQVVDAEGKTRFCGPRVVSYERQLQADTGHDEAAQE